LPLQTHRGRLGETGNARLIDSEGNASTVPEDGGIRSDFVLEENEFLGDKTPLLTTKNRIPGSVTVNALPTNDKVASCEVAKGIFAIQLDQARDVASCRPLVSAPGGRNLSIVQKTRDLLLCASSFAFWVSSAMNNHAHPRASPVAR